MKKLGKYIIVALLVISGGQFYGNLDVNAAYAESEKALVIRKQKNLREAAERFAKAYAQRDYETMYELLVPKYKRRVPLWEYKDFVEYPGVTDGFIEVEITDVSILPRGNFKFGKVMQKIVTSETQKIKTTGELIKKEDEKWEFQDWVEIDGNWLKIEKIDSN